MKSTLVTALCLFALAMACSRTEAMPKGYRSAYEEVLPNYEITETVHHFRGDAGLDERQ